MPADFDRCVAQGGRVRTIKPKPGSYMHVCYDSNGKAHNGEVQHSKKKGMDPGAAQLFEIRRRQEQAKIEALNEETEASQQSLRHRVELATHDTSMSVEAKENESKD